MDNCISSPTVPQILRSEVAPRYQHVSPLTSLFPFPGNIDKRLARRCPAVGSLEKVWIGGDPFPKAPDAGLLIHRRAPSHYPLRLADVAHVTRLVPRPPAVEANRDLLALKRSKVLDEFVPNRERIG